MNNGRTDMKKILIASILVTITLGHGMAQQQSLSLSQSIEIAADSSLQAFRAKSVSVGLLAVPHKAPACHHICALHRFYTTGIYAPVRFRNNIDIYRRQHRCILRQPAISQILTWRAVPFISIPIGLFPEFHDNVYSQFSSVPIRVGYNNPFSASTVSNGEENWTLNTKEPSGNWFMPGKNIRIGGRPFLPWLRAIGIRHGKETVVSLTICIKSDKNENRLPPSPRVIYWPWNWMRSTPKYLSYGWNNLKKPCFFVSFLNLEEQSDLRFDMPNVGIWCINGKPCNMPKRIIPTIYPINKPFLNRKEKSIVPKARPLMPMFQWVSADQVANDFRGAYRNPLEQDIVGVGLTILLVDWGVRRRANMAINNLNVTRISQQQSQSRTGNHHDSGWIQHPAGFDSVPKKRWNLATMAYQVTRPLHHRQSRSNSLDPVFELAEYSPMELYVQLTGLLEQLLQITQTDLVWFWAEEVPPEHRPIMDCNRWRG